MEDIDFTVGKDEGQEGEEEKIKKMREEYLGDGDEDLRHIGIAEDGDKIDFSNLWKSKKKKEKNEESSSQSIFGRLTGAFQNYTGNKTLTKADLEPILKEFAENLTDKNVASEIAQEICKSVEESLIDTKTASFTSIK